jgi:hypothetical protein
VRSDVLEKIDLLLFLLCKHLRREAYALLILVETLSDNALKGIKCASADKEDILGIDLDEFLIGMLSSALRRNV